MRIVIDMQGAQTGSRFRGIGRYTMALTRAIVRQRAEHEIILLLNGMLHETIVPIQDAFRDLMPKNKIRIWNALAPVYTDDIKNATRRNIAEAIREEYIDRLKPDILLITSFFEGFGDNAVHSIRDCDYGRSDALVASIFYDVIPLIQKEIYLDPNPHFQKPYYKKIEQLKKADLLLSISESSRTEAIEYLDFLPERVVNISSAVDDTFRPTVFTNEETCRFKARLGIRDRFIMYSGATDDRKNHIGLISSYALLPEAMRAVYQLVLVGGLPEEHKYRFEQHIKKCGLSDGDVVITGRVSDQDLLHAYNVCDLYVFPSWHEGFGLPALEAMSCGAPVIGANTTSVPEVIGFDRALFDPYSPRSIADKIQEVLTDPGLLAELKAHALVHSVKFSWDESAKRSIEAMETLASARSSVVSSMDVQNSAKAQGVLLQKIALQIAGSKEFDLLGLAQTMARNLSGVKSQLLVDVSELVLRDSHTGIQRVVRSILNEWLANPPENFDLRLVYANNVHIGYRYANSFTRRFLGQLSTQGESLGDHLDEDLSIDFGYGDVFVALDMQHEVQIFQHPFYQHMRAHGVDVRFVIYDLLPVTMPQYFPANTGENHALWLAGIVNVDGVVCISQAVAEEFGNWLVQNANDQSCRPAIDWFHLGADIENSVPTRGLHGNFEYVIKKIKSSFSFIMVGTLEPRKGYAEVLDAFNMLFDKGLICNLVLVGRVGWGMDDLVKNLRLHPESGHRLLWLESISDEYLEEVYEASTCLIAASYGEGFGLPLIEAAKHKLPILARDIPIFREVAGEHAFYFKADQSVELAQAIESWLDMYQNGQHPKSEHMPWLTWEKSAAQLLHALKQPAHNEMKSNEVKVAH